MADKQEDIVNKDDTKQEGVKHQVPHQEDDKQEGFNHQVLSQEVDKREVIILPLIMKKDVPQEGKNPKPEASTKEQDIIKEPKSIEQVAKGIKQEDFLKDVAAAKKRYYGQRTGFINPEDPDYIPEEELAKLIDRDIAQVLPNLYISQASCSIDPAILEQYHITSMISITAEPEWESPAIRALVPVERHVLLPVDNNKVINLLPFFESICNWIDEQIETPCPTAACGNGKGDNGRNNVLVHCCKGVSRSPTIALAYYLRKKYPNYTRGADSFEDIYEDFITTIWTRTWPIQTSTFLKQLEVWFTRGYQIWEDEEKKIPKWEYKKFLGLIRGPELKALQEIWEEATGESGAWRDGELGLTVVGVRDWERGDVNSAAWEEAKEIMQGIPKEKTLVEAERTIRRYVSRERRKGEEAELV